MNKTVSLDWEKFKPNKFAALSTIDPHRLIEIFGAHTNGIKQQRNRHSNIKIYKIYRYFNYSKKHISQNTNSNYLELIKAAFPWEPDIIITMSDMQILKDIFPNSLILFRDALYCREPFPDELCSFDLSGLYHNSKIGEIINNNDDKLVSDIFTKTFFPKNNYISNILQKNQLSENNFYILPLQDSNHYNFYDESKYVDQVELIIDAANKFPNEKILITQHPDKKEIKINDLCSLNEIYPNIIYISELEGIKNISAQLLPYAKAIIGVSTGLLVQALFLGLPVILMGKHALAEHINKTQSDQERKKIAYQLITKVFFSYRYLYDANWFLTRIFMLKFFESGILSSDDMMIDLPNNIIKYLIKDKRDLIQNDSNLNDMEIQIPQRDNSWNAAQQFKEIILPISRRKDILQLVRPNGIGIELGVAEGYFSSELLECNRLSHLYSIDMYAGDRGHDIKQYLIALKNLNKYQNKNTLIKMKFDEALHLFPDNYFDFIYIDGYAHTGEEGGQTFNTWFPKLTKGGVIGGHDYSEQFPAVIKAVNSFTTDNDLKLFIIEDKSGGWNFNAFSWFAIKPL